MADGAGGTVQDEPDTTGRPEIVREPPPTTRHDRARARRDASLRRHGVVLAVAIVAILLAVAVRDVPNPDHRPAVEATQALDRAVEAVRTGSVELTSTPQQVVPGVTGALVGGEERPLLVAEAADDCYTLVPTGTGDQVGQRFAESWECEPSSAMLLGGPQGGRTQLPPAPATDPYDWETALPDAVRWRPWYLFAVILLSGVAIGVAARMAITLLSGSPPGDEPDLGGAHEA